MHLSVSFDSLRRVVAVGLGLGLACIASAQITARGFGTSNNGRVVADVGSSADSLISAAIQTDGKIVAVGLTTYALGNQDVLVVRYNSDGTPDTSFNGTGRRTYSLGSLEERATAVFVQSDGKIVLCGYVNFGSPAQDDMFIMRLGSTGAPDATFNSQGYLTFNFGGTFDRAYGVSPAPGGGYYVGGSRNNGSRWDFALARITSAGALDTAFDTDGKVTIAATTSSNEAFALAVQSDGKILLAGRGNESSYVWPVVRLTTSGALDTSFDGDGKALVSIGLNASQSTALGMAIASDGKIVLGGVARNTANTYNIVGLARLTTAGALDTTFDGDGLRTHDLGANFAVTAFLLSADNRPIIIGNNATNDIRVLRYTSTGGNDTSFAGTGGLTIDYGSLGDRAYGGVVQPDTKILVVGDANGDLAMARFIPDGTPDVKLTATVTLLGLAQEYTGSARVVTAATTPSGLPVAITYNGGSTPPVAIGDYTVVGTVNSPLYQGSSTGTLTVSRASQTITFASPGDRVLGSAPFAVAPTASSGLPVEVIVLSGPATISNKTVTLTGTGQVTLRASQAGDSVYQPAPSVDVSFEVVSAFSSWISGYSVGAASGPSDDPDADGLPNLLEYALGGQPDFAQSAPAPVATVSGGLLRLAYPRARADVTYTVETSTALESEPWTSAGVTQDITTPVGQTAIATIPHDPATTPRRFLRLRVSL